MKSTLRMQRYVGAALVVLLLSACQSNSFDVLDTPDGEASSPADSVGKAVQRIAPSTLPLMTTPGTWLKPPQGPLFEPMDTLDPRNAMIYVYRPSTSWEDQELQAPTFFINGAKVFGLKSGSYTWVELHAGTFDFYAKRPLSILFIKKIFQLEMKLEGGSNYYLRYSEDAPFDYVDNGLNPDEYMHAGFLQQVPESVALNEIASLKLDQQGVYFEAGRVAQHRWAPFETFPETGADPDDEVVEDAGIADAPVGDAGETESAWQRVKRMMSRLNPF